MQVTAGVPGCLPLHLLFIDSTCPPTVRPCLPCLPASLVPSPRPPAPRCLRRRYHGMPPRPRDTPPRTSPLTWRGARQADGDHRWQCMKCSSRRLPPSNASSHHNISLPQSRAPAPQHIRPRMAYCCAQGADACILFLGSRIRKGEDEPTGTPVSPSAGHAMCHTGSAPAPLHATLHPAVCRKLAGGGRAQRQAAGWPCQALKHLMLQTARCASLAAALYSVCPHG